MDARSVKSIVKHCFPNYKGRTFNKRVSQPGMNMRSYWNEGSRDWYVVVELATGKKSSVPENGSPFTAELGPEWSQYPKPGFAVAKLSHWRRDTATLHLSPEDAEHVGSP